MSASYQPRYINAVLVMTAGVDNAPGRHLHAALVQQLRKLYNPDSRVEIIRSCSARQGNFAALQQVAAATGGAGFEITSPYRSTAVFFRPSRAGSCRWTSGICAAVTMLRLRGLPATRQKILRISANRFGGGASSM